MYFPVDHDEYVQIPGEALEPVPADGPALSRTAASTYDIRITEELHEVAFLDRLQLIAVDHPAAIDIFTNDKFKAPPFPEFRLFGVPRDGRVYPVTALDGHGRDVRPALLAKDRRTPTASDATMRASPSCTRWISTSAAPRPTTAPC